MNERVKELREMLGISQAKFGETLGFQRDAISKIETGKNALTEQNIRLICQTSWSGRRVSERWLREGVGDMFVESSEAEEIAASVADVLKADRKTIEYNVLKAIAKLPRETWVEVERLVDVLAGADGGQSK